MDRPTVNDIKQAYTRIFHYLRQTPLLRSGWLTEHLSALAGHDVPVFLKLENLQFTGSYKLRGSLNAMLSNEQKVRQKGVVTASAGNHAQGVAFAARKLRIQQNTIVVMANGASDYKVDRTEAYGVRVIPHGQDFDEAYDMAQQIARDEDKLLIPAYDHPDVIAGQGTLALEIFDENKEIDTVVVPIGGGGLISGVCVAAKGITEKKVTILGVEAATHDSMYQSLKAERIIELPKAKTIADGIAVRKPGELNFDILRWFGMSHNDIARVQDEEIFRAMYDLADDEHIIAEGAGAAGVAMVREHHDHFPQLRQAHAVAVVLSGGNVTVQQLEQFRIEYTREASG